jgi:hypothetical protein
MPPVWAFANTPEELMKLPTIAICIVAAGATLSVGACTNGGKNQRADTTGFTAGSAAGQVSPAPLPTTGAADSAAAAATAAAPGLPTGTSAAPPLDSAKDSSRQKTKAPPP